LFIEIKLFGLTAYSATTFISLLTLQLVAFLLAMSELVFKPFSIIVYIDT